MCEGSTDVVVLRRLAEEVLGSIDARTLQPETDELDRAVPNSPSGWSEVKVWCERLSSYQEYFDPLVGDAFDLVIVAIDLDIAVRTGLQKAPENLKAYDAKALCDVVKSWLPSPIDGRVLIAIPVMSVEAWILAALFPKAARPQLEPKPAEVLVDRKKISMGKRGPWKRVTEYRAFAVAVASKLKRVRDACSEADRFVRKLSRFVSE